MTQPNDRTSLHAEVDERYHARHPEAPATLDPENPDHRGWIERWIAIRDEVLVDATNWHFFDQFPEAPRHLDPNDDDHALWIDQWIRIRDEILGDGVTRWDTAPAAQEPAPAPAAQDGAASFQEARAAAEQWIADHITSLIGADAARPVIEHLDQQLTEAKTLMSDDYFSKHDHWVGDRRDFDIGVGINNVAIEVRLVAPGQFRIGVVGDGPSDVGGWEYFPGAPTQ